MPTDTREEALDRIREQARARASQQEGVSRPAPRANSGYYGLPLLKEPVWSRSIPLYFFVGGAAGAAAVIALAARTAGREALARDARRFAAGGAAISAALLTEDLGRPSRFLNMLRVIKPQSPMSVGSWTLTAFGGAATAAWLLSEKAPPPRVLKNAVSLACDTAAAATGLMMTTYTGVLIGATAIPVWNDQIDLLPAHFGAAALASATSMLELRGHDDRALHLLAAAASVAETAAGARIELTASPASRPLRTGASGALVRLGGLLSGPVPLALRLAARRRPRIRRLAAWAAIAGSLITRFGWLRAGTVSADDPSIPLQLPQDRIGE